ncbi:hypothetical protein CYMTET_50322 [Cymbomonas tetramitiformis]|uniref:Uncharacterized protein n=1 Tax=Cymbomonas tetramitiformis TaxID=36881 RepID=A0AAE0BNG0_9CHLO|nr:hypothetical protein CYMTET_50322 [Cymbomonas tetramitiformis]
MDFGSSEELQKLVERARLGTSGEASEAARLLWGVGMNKKNVKAIVHAGAVKPLLQLVTLDTKDEDGKGFAVAALRGLAIDDLARQQLLQLGAIEVLLPLLERHAEDVAADAAGVFQEFARDERFAEDLGGPVHGDSVLNMLVSLAEKGGEEAREASVGALQALAEATALRERVAQHALPSLLRLLSSREPDISTVCIKKALWALGGLAREAHLSEAIGAAGGLRTLVELLDETRPRSVRTAVAGTLLCLLVAGGSDSDNAQRALDAGVGDCLVGLLRDGGLEEVEFAAAALGALAQHPGGDGLIKGDNHVVTALLHTLPQAEGLSRHDDVENAACASALALQHLAKWESGAAAIGESGGIERLVQLMSAGGGSVRASAAGCVAALAGHPSTHERILQTDAVPQLTQLLHAEDGAARGKMQAASALWHLSSQARHTLVSSHTVSAVTGPVSLTEADSLLLRAAAAFGGAPEQQRSLAAPMTDMLRSPVPEIQEVGSAALAQLGCTTGGARAAYEAGALEPAISAAGVGGCTHLVREGAVHLLSQMCQLDGEVVQEVVAAGGLRTAVGLMEDAASSHTSRSSAASILFTAAQVPEHREKLVHMGSASSLIGAIATGVDPLRGTAIATLAQLSCSVGGCASIVAGGGVPQLMELLTPAPPHRTAPAASPGAPAPLGAPPRAACGELADNVRRMELAGACLLNITCSAAGLREVAAGGVMPFVRLLLAEDSLLEYPHTSESAPLCAGAAPGGKTPGAPDGGAAETAAAAGAADGRSVRQMAVALGLLCVVCQRADHRRHLAEHASAVAPALLLLVWLGSAASLQTPVPRLWSARRAEDTRSEQGRLESAAEAASLLSVLCAEVAEARAAVLGAGCGVSTLVEALAPECSEDLREYAASVLWLVADSPLGTAAIVEAGGVAPLVHLVTPGDTAAHAASAVLGNIAADNHQGVVATIVGLGGMQRLLAMIQAYVDDAEGVAEEDATCATAALRSLACVGDEEVLNGLVQGGAVETLEALTGGKLVNNEEGQEYTEDALKLLRAHESQFIRATSDATCSH